MSLKNTKKSVKLIETDMDMDINMDINILEDLKKLKIKKEIRLKRYGIKHKNPIPGSFKEASLKSLPNKYKFT